MLRRLAAALLICLVSAGWWVTPASADDRIGVGNPGQSSSYALVRSGQGLNVTVFAGSGPAYGPDLRVDLSALASDVSVAAEGNGCVRTAAVIECGTLYSMRIEPAAGAGPGQAGRVKVSNTSSSASITVDVMTSVQSTLVGNSPTVTGAIGDVVKVTVSVRNEGPNTLYRGGIAGISLQDKTELVSIDGCQPGPSQCTEDNFRAGTSIDVTLHLRIVGCDLPGDSGGYGLTSNPGAKMSPGRFKVKVSGCGGGTTGGGSSTGGGGRPGGGPAPSSPAAAAIEVVQPPTPSAEPSTQVTSGGAASPEPIVPAADAGRNQTSSLSLPILAGAIIIVLGAGAFGFQAYRRRHPRTLETLTDDS